MSKPRTKKQEPAGASETIKLTEIHLNDGTHGLPKNPRFIRDDRFRTLVASVKDFPEAMPARGIVVDEAGVILGGNMRYRACRELGMAEIPATWVKRLAGLTTEQKRRFILKDNRSMGDDDDALLKADWTADEMAAAGFDQADLDRILAEEPEHDPVETTINTKADDLNKKWKVKPGDLWQVGDHRIICASCTDPKAWARLMKGERAVLCHTDPPYGVSYAGTGTAKWEVIKGDRKREDDLLTTLLVPAFRLAAKHTEPDAPFYIWHASSSRRDFEKALDAVGLEEKQYIVWIKDSFVLGHADYHWQQEPAFFCQKSGESSRWLGDRKQSTVWKIRPPAPAEMTIDIANGIRLSFGEEGNPIFLGAKAPKGKKTRLLRLAAGDEIAVQVGSSTDAWQITRDASGDKLHPNQKPVALFRIPIENHTKPGDLVVEPFSGSGAQILAAQETGRRCYALDLDPKFVAVALERAEQAGLHPMKEPQP